MFYLRVALGHANTVLLDAICMGTRTLSGRLRHVDGGIKSSNTPSFSLRYLEEFPESFGNDETAYRKTQSLDN